MDSTMLITFQLHLINDYPPRFEEDFIMFHFEAFDTKFYFSEYFQGYQV